MHARRHGVALLAASLVLTYSVVSRYFFKAATDWQDEVAVFCIVGAVFLARRVGAGAARAHRHRGASRRCSRRASNRVRVIFVDVLSLAFCAFFAWKSWTLFHEAWVDKHDHLVDVLAAADDPLRADGARA